MHEKVLVIDDALMLRTSARRALTGGGFDVLEATDGVAGLAQVAAHPDIVLVFCDLNMPNMSGIEFLEQLQEQRGRSVSVVMLTSEMQPEIVAHAKRLGALGWLSKPCSGEVLVATARRFVTLASIRPEIAP